MVSFGKKERGGDEEIRISGFRIYFMVFVILLMSLMVLLRLYALSVLAHEDYKEIADNQHKLRQEIRPERGEIFVQEGENLFPVAINRELKTCFAIPKDVTEPLQTAKTVAEILELNREEVEYKLSKSDDLYEVLKRKLTPEEADLIRTLDLPGIRLEGEQWRYYPSGSLASHVLGFVGYKNEKSTGQYGIEQYFNKQLEGSSGMLEQERDTFGRWISIGSKSKVPAQDGTDFILNIDHVLQFKAELALKNAVARHGADGGKVIIIEPHSGKILAMAAYPTFDLNNYSEAKDISVYRNPIISDEYECGSVFKTITMAAGLDMGKVKPETTYTDTGQVTEAGYIIKNSDEKSHGLQTMTQVIEESLNTGAIFVQKQVGNENFLRYVKEFGFGQKTGIELPGEVGGKISNLYTNRNIEFFTASFGQGITVTPLQLAMAYGAIANGGTLMAPWLIDYTESIKGERDQREEKALRQVVSKETANQLTLMLESNVVNGHGKPAGVPGYRVAGKTGTAQIPDKEKGGYLEDATTGTFAGFGPIDNPAFAMVTIIDHPRDVEWAESTAGPIFGEMAKFMFDYWGIETTEEYSQEDLARWTRSHNYLMSEKEKEEKDE